MTDQVPLDLDLLKEAIDYYGPHAQIMKACEECSELQVELHHWLRNWKVAFVPQEEKLRDELADVLIMVMQLREIFGTAAVDAQVQVKLERLRKRIRIEPEPHRWQGPT